VSWCSRARSSESLPMVTSGVTHGDCARIRGAIRASTAAARNMERIGLTSSGLNLARVSFGAMRFGIALTSLLLVATASAAAQAERPIPVASEVFVGSELESYLRVLQLRGIVPGQPWSLRPFSPAQLARLAPP